MELPRLTANMVKAAGELYDDHFQEWQLCNSALGKLKGLLPDWDEESCLAKAAAVNELYGTNVYLLVPLARSIAKVMQARPVRDASLVALLSIHPTTNKRHVSFASKFCHFFISQETYPILDDVACDTLKHFLGKNYAKHEPRYESFIENLGRLRSSSPGLDVASIDNVALDRFLWLFGLWTRVKTNPCKAKVNKEAERVFKRPPADIMQRLDPCWSPTVTSCQSV